LLKDGRDDLHLTLKLSAVGDSKWPKD